ncbi:PIN domain-containing protein [Candidatus Albibeggiatoa sp. nov. NOAA]|uniref:type II toxin-antitoxin system VapC family toxin n=1 Tax=Candidatus Albibeggiatoa sp. nov. NOAA TaxID=3162724 RepID=UPI0032FDA134|nr:PIN domain-containing protein [Thiotrichaceae bacterium]
MIIADTGFWVSLFNESDKFHHLAIQCYEKVVAKDESLITTCAVMTETCHLLMKRAGVSVQQKFITSFHKGAFIVFELKIEQGERLQLLMQKYQDLPMDLADASLVILAEHLGHGRILSTDQRDFGVYRWKQTYPFVNLMFP